MKVKFNGNLKTNNINIKKSEIGQLYIAKTIHTGRLPCHISIGIYYWKNRKSYSLQILSEYKLSMVIRNQNTHTSLKNLVVIPS